MGLRLLDSYHEYNEAVIARAALDHAGILAIIANEDLLRIAPYYNLALGGFRLLVSELDLEAAAAVLKEATADPITEGGTLLVRGDFMDRLTGLVWGFFAGGTPTPIREFIWNE